jgi:TIR domain
MAQAHAFVSYVRDNSDIIDNLARDLRAFGVKVWLDRDDILPGQWWEDAINQAIQNGAFFIACYSQELRERQETYMNDELRLAIDRLRRMPKNRVWFIPVFLNDTEIPPHNIIRHEKLSDINTIRL